MTWCKPFSASVEGPNLIPAKGSTNEPYVDKPAWILKVAKCDQPTQRRLYFANDQISAETRCQRIAEELNRRRHANDDNIWTCRIQPTKQDFV